MLEKSGKLEGSAYAKKVHTNEGATYDWDFIMKHLLGGREYGE